MPGQGKAGERQGKSKAKQGRGKAGKRQGQGSGQGKVKEGRGKGTWSELLPDEVRVELLEHRGDVRRVLRIHPPVPAPTEVPGTVCTKFYQGRIRRIRRICFLPIKGVHATTVDYPQA